MENNAFRYNSNLKAVGVFQLLSKYISDHPDDFKVSNSCNKDCDKCHRLLYCSVTPRVELFAYNIVGMKSTAYIFEIATNLTVKAEIYVYYNQDDYGRIVTRIYHVMARFDSDSLSLISMELCK